jgi:large repetitive protein
VRAKPVVTWLAPAALAYGTALSPIQLDANASVPGTFSYTPSIGTVLAPGLHRLTVTFAPADAALYLIAQRVVKLRVGRVPTTTSMTFAGTTTFGSETGEAFSVSVSSPFSVTPSGTVNIFSGSKLLCGVTLDESGEGSCTITSDTALAAGSHSITATYGGAADFERSASTPSTLKVEH